MYKQKLLFWCSFFYYLVNIYSIVVAVNLYLQGGNTNTTYFITFFSIFGIDKLLILIITYGHEDGCSGFIFAICDIFQIGFVYIFFDDNYQQYNLGNALKTKVYSRIIPQIIMEFIFFFCLRDLLISETDLRNEILTLVKLISQLERKNRQAVIKQIEVLYYYQAIEYFKEYKDEIISSLIDIDDHLLIELCYYTREEYLIKMFNQRVQNGFILNQTTYQIVDWISSKKKEYQILQPFKSCQLQVTLFNKMFSPLMQFQPTQILYDLYEDY